MNTALRWAIILGAAVIGGTVAHGGHVWSGFLIFGVGIAVAHVLTS